MNSLAACPHSKLARTRIVVARVDSQVTPQDLVIDLRAEVAGLSQFATHFGLALADGTVVSDQMPYGFLAQLGAKLHPMTPTVIRVIKGRSFVGAHSLPLPLLTHVVVGAARYSAETAFYQVQRLAADLAPSVGDSLPYEGFAASSRRRARHRRAVSHTHSRRRPLADTPTVLSRVCSRDLMSTSCAASSVLARSRSLAKCRRLL